MYIFHHSFISAPEGWKAKVVKMMPMAEPSDISNIVLFLASKESRWVSGSVVSANCGGITTESVVKERNTTKH